MAHVQALGNPWEEGDDSGVDHKMMVTTEGCDDCLFQWNPKKQKDSIDDICRNLEDLRDCLKPCDGFTDEVKATLPDYLESKCSSDLFEVPETTTTTTTTTTSPPLYCPPCSNAMNIDICRFLLIFSVLSSALYFVNIVQ
uniref:Uncharacterized protein n=1 Tax=Ditylenchus dipsaci TaxID=166011 RepID=A0A915DXR3_9BILA